MMSRSGVYPYFEGSGFRAVALAYGDDMFRFYVVLPDEGSSLAELVASLENAAGWDWIQRLEPRSGEVVLPRFTMTSDLTLNEVLKDLGMQRAFDPALADFSGLADTPIWINRVRHKGWIEVNERGTEAAATTVVEMTAGTVEIPEARFQMVVDRPFLCAVRDRMTGVILFLGAVTHPRRI